MGVYQLCKGKVAGSIPTGDDHVLHLEGYPTEICAKVKHVERAAVVPPRGKLALASAAVLPTPQ